MLNGYMLKAASLAVSDVDFNRTPAFAGVAGEM
jgi:hypothetical protein